MNSSLPFLITHYVKTIYLTFQPLPVNIRTTRYSIQQSYIVIIRKLCLVWTSKQTTNFALQNTKRSVFITEEVSVYSAVRTESLYNTDTIRL